MTPDELRRLIAAGETADIEFKDEGRDVFYESARKKRAVAQFHREVAERTETPSRATKETPMILRQCKCLAEVEFPIAVVSKHAAREKLIRHEHPIMLHP